MNYPEIHTDFKKGLYGQIEINDIKDRSIKLQINNYYPNTLKIKLKQVKTKKAWRIINLIQMQRINREFQYLIERKFNDTLGTKNYIENQYIEDENVSKINPTDFYLYYYNKQKILADSIMLHYSEK